MHQCQILACSALLVSVLHTDAQLYSSAQLLLANAPKIITTSVCDKICGHNAPSCFRRCNNWITTAQGNEDDDDDDDDDEDYESNDDTDLDEESIDEPIAMKRGGSVLVPGIRVMVMPRDEEFGNDFDDLVLT